MEPSYKIIGSDGNEYGPVTLDQLKDWIHEGRLDGETQVQRSDQNAWGPAASLSELGLTSSPPPALAPPSRPVPSAPIASLDERKLASAVKSGASWFYWIAALSLITSISALSGSSWGFAIGLGITQVFDGLASEVGGAGKAVALVLDLLAAGVFVFFGVFANKGHAWAFLVGMGLYALDGFLLLLFSAWLSVGFHAFALFCVFGGFSANRKLKARRGA